MAQRRSKKTDGFAVVESTSVVVLMILLITGLFMILYLSFTKIWIKSALYDGLVCIKEHNQDQDCRQRTENRLHYLPLGRTRNLHLGTNGEGHAILEMKDHLSLEIHQSLPEALK